MSQAVGMSGEAPTILTVACSPRHRRMPARAIAAAAAAFARSDVVVCIGSRFAFASSTCLCSALGGGGGSHVMGAGTLFCASDALGTASVRPCASAGRLNAVRAAVKPLETLCNVPICSGSYSYVMLI